MELEIACAPEMKKAGREKLYNNLHKQAFPQEPVAMTPEMLNRLING